jgi:hypothetical protein
MYDMFTKKEYNNVFYSLPRIHNTILTISSFGVFNRECVCLEFIYLIGCRFASINRSRDKRTNRKATSFLMDYVLPWYLLSCDVKKYFH